VHLVGYILEFKSFDSPLLSIASTSFKVLLTVHRAMILGNCPT